MNHSDIENQWLQAMEQAAAPLYDPKGHMLSQTFEGNIHTEHLQTKLTKMHPVRESLYYAQVLLRLGGTENIKRAVDIVERVIDLQENADPAHELYGLWHYIAEEPVLEWPFPDKNWADFNGMSLLLIYHLEQKSLSDELKEKLKAAIGRAAICIRRRNVTLEYTNIAIKGTFVTLAAGELLQDQSLLDYAQDRMRRLHATIFATGSFAEYNSPTYAAVSLGALMALDRVVKHEPSLQLARAIQHRFWMHLATHFHVPSAELGGPHSRAYTLSMRDSSGPLGPLIEKATGGAVRYGVESPMKREAFAPIMACLLEPDLPKEAAALFGNPDRIEEVREVTRLFQEGSNDTLTSYIHPAFCVGSVNFMDGWEQRHNLIAYWPVGKESGYFQHYYLHDQRPCCSGWFTADQAKGTMLAGSFLGNYADHHVSFEIDHVQASFLGTIWELNNAGETFSAFKNDQEVQPGQVVELLENDVLSIRLTHVWIALKLLRHQNGLPAAGVSSDNRVMVSREASQLRIEFPHYRGESRQFKWHDFNFAHTCYALVVEPSQADWQDWTKRIMEKPAIQREVGTAVEIEWEGRKLSLPPILDRQEGVRAFFGRNKT